jgi:hypothetical protein
MTLPPMATHPSAASPCRSGRGTRSTRPGRRAATAADSRRPSPTSRGGGCCSPALTIRGPGNVTWAQGIRSIRIHDGEYFVGPENISWGPESRGELRTKTLLVKETPKGAPQMPPLTITYHAFETIGPALSKKISVLHSSSPKVGPITANAS